MFLDRALKNAVVNVLTVRARDPDLLFGPRSTAYIWAHTSKGSPLRRCVMDCAVTETGAAYWEKNGMRYGKEFLHDLMVASMQERDEPGLCLQVIYSNRCRYHDHAEGESRCV